MLDTNKISRDSLVSVQRAFVNFKGIDSSGITPTVGVKVPGLDDKKHGFQFRSLWENSGSTPAVSVLTFFSIDDIPDDKADKFQFATPKGTRFTKTVIGPKSSGSSGAIVRPDGFWEVLSNKHSLYFWGWRIYRDVFPHTPTRVTEFCASLFAVVLNIQASSDRNKMSLLTFEKLVGSKKELQYAFQFGDCEGRHNCADADCEDYEKISMFADLRQ